MNARAPHSSSRGLEVRRDDFTVYVRPELVVEIAFSDVQEVFRQQRA